MNSCGASVMTTLPLGTIAAVVLVVEGHAVCVERDQTPVRDGDPVGIAREIGEHGVGAGERRLGVDHEPLLPDCGEVTRKNSTITEISLGAEEGKSSGCVELDQPGEEQAAEEHAQHPHRQEEGRTDDIHCCPLSEMPPPAAAETATPTEALDIKCRSHVWRTAVMPMRAPSASGQRSSSSSPTPRGTADRRRSPCSARRCRQSRLEA